jgi:thiamine biosynthesis lipoprotein
MRRFLSRNPHDTCRTDRGSTLMKYAACLMLLTCLLPGSSLAGWHHQEAAIMGTVINVELWLEDEDKATALIDEVMQEMRRIDDLMSTYKPDSQLSLVNATAAITPVAVNTELFALIQRALEYSDITHGAFDITYASAGRYYDYRKGVKPTEAQLAEALPAIDYHHVRLDAATGTVTFTQPGVYIDLGGIAKGYAVDRGMAILRRGGVENALVSAGGDSLVIGKRWKHPWYIGIRDPRDKTGIVSMIPLEDAAISTSGDYERYFEQDGVRYHHILDPGTGKSTHSVRSTSIIGSTATDTDALSTSVFVLGVDAGLQLINSLPDTEAVIIDKDGALHYSSGLARVQ